ncbi:uncharacterized protein LOC125705230 isoform X2 [Brienomyrus brachyistius]|uniref:uncharacterized protein LOC125705230 isoform X2 n=1 Tax=Brienomyrus brachyistius TaxID=42636 RepID=UPI0020B309F4|nr:uncharacterized protein LOC125705230 isoform X2 [Brienomyrus brachyistius]
MDRSAVFMGCLILFLLWRTGYIEALKVTQSPHQLSVPMGHAAFMSCCWEGNSSYIRLRFTWIKNFSKPGIGTHLVLINQTETSCSSDSDDYKFEISSKCYNLTILSVTSKDVSLYTCEIQVEIPVLVSFTGPGTNVSIQADDQIKALTSGVGVAVPLAAAVMVLCCCTTVFYLWKRWTSGRHHGGMAVRAELQRSMEEMNEIDEAAEHHSNSSRGSEQWCPVQLYESIDYFLVQNNVDT